LKTFTRENIHKEDFISLEIMPPVCVVRTPGNRYCEWNYVIRPVGYHDSIASCQLAHLSSTGCRSRDPGPIGQQLSAIHVCSLNFLSIFGGFVFVGRCCCAEVLGWLDEIKLKTKKLGINSGYW
jgi:hypothetical protein